MESTHILRYSNRDACLIALSLLHPMALLLAPSVLLIAAGVWWNSNTISHHFLHLPFFRSGIANRAYSLYLSVILGIPQSLWRERHLSHHRGLSVRMRCTPAILLELALIALLWSLLLSVAPYFFLMVYLPGYAAGLLLCYLHGRFEHVGGTTSYYGSLYNAVFFNDGYHVEHHERPSEHWTRLPGLTAGDTRTSRWPAVFRWMERVNLETLERMVLRSDRLQSFLLNTHERAVRKLLPHLPVVRTVTIVGGGMYPRTALLLRKLLPDATIRIVDSNADHLEIAKAFLDESIELEQGHYYPGRFDESDVLVVPLSFNGSRESVYRNPPVPAVLVHDWIWSRRGRSAIVSLLLLKRLNLITR